MTRIWKHALFAITLLCSLTLASPVWAGDGEPIRLAPGESQSLSMCKGDAGTVKATRSGETIHVSFKDVTCSELDVFKTADGSALLKTYKLTGTTMPRSASFTMPKKVVEGAETIKLRLRSNSGKHADWVHVQVAAPRPELPLNEGSALPACKGSIKITHSVNQGTPQVNVVLKNVANCDQFEIESNNGRSINKTYTIQGKSGKRNGSFTLSWKKVIDKGSWNFKTNNINIKLSGKDVADLFVVRFEAGS